MAVHASVQRLCQTAMTAVRLLTRCSKARLGPAAAPRAASRLDGHLGIEAMILFKWTSLSVLRAHQPERLFKYADEKRKQATGKAFRQTDGMNTVHIPENLTGSRVCARKKALMGLSLSPHGATLMNNKRYECTTTETRNCQATHHLRLDGRHSPNTCK
mmetsp:Transcript_2158/g.4924  ORF Transcript_2158/g.4924 Transcript_2158/m.4924 type:complete len:159 (+) Transcript_2158:660-1136(+)